MKKGILLILIILTVLKNITSQIAPGQWRDHLSYYKAEKVVLAGNKVYCMTFNSLFYYNKTDNTVNTISKVQGLAETEFSTIAYSTKLDVLIIAYVNSNIDIVQKNKIVNVPYIKNKLGISDKRINDITILGKYAYLACNYGISVLDLEKLIIIDTYYPSTTGTLNRVNNICFDSTNIYAATQFGIFKANKDDQYLVNYSRWMQIKEFPNYSKECNKIRWVNGHLFTLYKNNSNTVNDVIMYSAESVWNELKSDIRWINSIDVSNNKLIISAPWAAIYSLDENLIISGIGSCEDPAQAVVDTDGTLWIADKSTSLIKKIKNGENEPIVPNSPHSNDVVKLDCKSSMVWIAGGGRDEVGTPKSSNSGVSGYFNNTWHSYASNSTEFLATMGDFINIKIDPLNPNRVFMANWTAANKYGLLEYNNGAFSLYNDKNSTLSKFQSGSYSAFYTYGLSFDSDNNLWVTNSNVTKPLSVLTNQGKWYSFSLGDANNSNIGDVVATSWGPKWTYTGKTTKITVFDDNGTIDKTSDDQVKSFTLSGIESTINSTIIYCMVEDKNQTIWVGTDAGPVVFDYPQEAFDESSTLTGRKVLVRINKNETRAAYLLETERINAITIDGNNRKWMGTQNSGVYLFNDDGSQVNHFTAENSPLFSNTINDISIDGKSGEVYFGTSKGLISYRGKATEGGTEFGKVYVFPNPVRENYNGNVYVTGLLENCNVKITDISGNLVFETNALGGQAVWDGKNLLHNRVNTGVYLVFCSNKDGSKTYVTKLLFIH